MKENVEKSEEKINMYTSGIAGRAKKILVEKGFGFLVRKTCVFAWRFFYGLFFLRFRPRRFFTFRNERFSYFYHPDNFTWDNERAVEIPVILKKLESYKGGKILEFGNVLSHYVPVTWDVLDKFEKGDRIIIQDVVDFKPLDKYDLIISISTLEHVGFDDDILDPNRITEAISNLKHNCLKLDGRMIFTMPLGYNVYMDNLLFQDKLGFDDKYYVKRISGKEWIEVTKEELGDVSYGTKYIEASAIVIAGYHGGRTKEEGER